jgi:hypothetical protein
MAPARTTSGTRLRTCVLVCALFTLVEHARAQELPVETSAEQQLLALRDEVQHAQFERATSAAHNLLARVDLRAHQRNDTLELLAIAQIAARDEAAAQGTLQELFARDPEHAPKLRDPGPQVEAAFARVHFSPRPPPSVPVETAAVRDIHGRTRIEVTLGAGRDAVESVDLFATGAGEAMHLVAEVGSEATVALTLPALSPELLARPDPKLSLYVEARAPSGYVIGRDGTHDAPLQVRLEPERDAPLRKQWWLWTSVAIVVAGVAIGGAIAAH